ncbi:MULTISPECIES: LysR substrate-binding domain-containing protein [unclassified Achromobacter]|uniref:LysR substrate-binding domain-containing protein n=1 Tax=unclassified Achromobacter TaxID=2626865 RepID=UPI00069FF95C|nr:MULTISPECIES: LysR substrate-binding domain-containing protein [unclassified Achromobacter]KOF52860.1 LysR family transcriptional regulator [Achromobacter sp. DMS1]
MPDPKSLPPLASLRAFEAAARRLSFSLAAQELFVTQSAVSHQIQRLEAALGTALFERRTREIALTQAGRAYYARVSAAFALLREGTETVRAAASPRKALRVGLLSSFAMRWLAPRLPDFAARHGDIELQLRPDIALADVAGGEVDVAVRYGRGAWTGVRSRLIMRERLSVVCAPALLAGRRLREPAALRRYTLLKSHNRHPFEWEAWARAMNCDLSGARSVNLHDYNIVVEAALAGQGMAMGRHRLLAPQLASGALVEALPGAALDDPRIGWWFVAPPGPLSGPAQCLLDWLLEAARADAGRT